MTSWTDRLQSLDDRVLGPQRLGRPTPSWVVPVVGIVLLLLAVVFAATDQGGPALQFACGLVGLAAGATYARRLRK